MSSLLGYAVFAAALFAGGAWTAFVFFRRFFIDGFEKALNLRLPTMAEEIAELRAEKNARRLAEDADIRRSAPETPEQVVARMMREESEAPIDPDNPLGPVPPMPSGRRGRG